MKKTRMGCFTTSGIMAAVLTALIVTGFAFASGGMVFSPGGLNARARDSLGGVSSHTAQATEPLGGVNSHAEIAGQCNLCHAPFWANTTMADRCVACHTDVAVQWLDKSTLHGVLRQNNPNLACRNCHPDHRGPDSPLIDLGRTRFPHNTVGFSLTGHQTKSDGSLFSCNDCHIQRYTSFDQTICSTCHTQVDAAFLQTHSQDFGSDCRDCHDGVDTFGHNFDHNKAPFQLIGKHAQVLCTKCHIEARLLADLKSIPQDCNSCHAEQDVHEGRLGPACGTCHNPTGWAPAPYDHNLSAFKLDGQHMAVACQKCHIDHVLQGTPSDCFACHSANDTHKGRLGNSCGTCHTTAGWAPALYDHNLSAFKLSGQHVTVTCSKCHINHVLQGTPTNCYACHAGNDTHQGHLGTNCATCHSTSGWKPAVYDHNLSIFKLTGQHIQVTCLNCHVNDVFKGTPANCNSCHAGDDVHHGQFGTDCSTCHSTSGWKPASYNHNLSAFKLTGKHVQVACLSCHVNGIFKGTPSNCFSCHASDDTHHGQYGTSCSTCHSTSGWLPSTFNHNLSAFKLTGQHVQVACLSCHINGVFKGTPTNCNSCHAGQNAHGGQFGGTSCGSCHTTSGWLPSTFNHNMSTFKLTGLHIQVNCLGCHLNGVFKGTTTSCNSCHAGPNSHSGQFFSANCSTCHTTSGWLPATVNHNLTGFSLTGAHTNLGCEQCHSGDGYGGLSSACSACHAEPSGHFGSNCANCHSTSNWNASYSHPGFPMTGGHSGLSCASCHSGGLGGLSTACSSCHSEPSGHYGSNCTNCHTTSNWNFSHPSSGCDGNCQNHEHASCTDCHTSNYSSYTCTACHKNNNPGD